MIDGLKITRVLDISVLEDRKELKKAAYDLPDLMYLLNEYLDDYIRIFTKLEWHKVYSGGLLSIKTSSHHFHSFDLIDVLKLTKAILKLNIYKGFEKLMIGFNNPSQITSTYFEVMVANWCVDRDISLSIEFSPKVFINGKYKYPDFLWHTKLGSVYCECKSGNILESNFHIMITDLTSYLKEIYDKYSPWPNSLRIDIRFEKGTTNKIKKRFESVIKQASETIRCLDNYIEKKFVQDDVSAVLRNKNVPLPSEEECISSGLAEVNTIAMNLPSITYLTLTMSLVHYRQKVVAQLLRDAKTQIPPDSVGFVFINLDGYQSAQQKVIQLFNGSILPNIPLVSIWTQSKIATTIWRNHQPFNSDALKPKENISD